MRSDLYRASLHDRDLAVTTAFFNGEALGAPGRSVDGWQHKALEAMAGRLEELGWRIERDRPSIADTGQPAGIISERTEILGALRGHRYGWEAPILVRVDDCGEIYARLAEPGDVSGAELRKAEEGRAPEFRDLDIQGRWVPESQVTSVIAALAAEQHDLAVNDGLGWA